MRNSTAVIGLAVCVGVGLWGCATRQGVDVSTAHGRYVRGEISMAEYFGVLDHAHERGELSKEQYGRQLRKLYVRGDVSQDEFSGMVIMLDTLGCLTKGPNGPVPRD